MLKAIQWLSVTFRVRSELLGLASACFCVSISYLSCSHSPFCSSVIQACSHLRAFAVAVPATWHTLFPGCGGVSALWRGLSSPLCLTRIPASTLCLRTAALLPSFSSLRPCTSPCLALSYLVTRVCMDVCLLNETAAP